MRELPNDFDHSVLDNNNIGTNEQEYEVKKKNRISNLLPKYIVISLLVIIILILLLVSIRSNSKKNVTKDTNEDKNSIVIGKSEKMINSDEEGSYESYQ